MIRNYLILAGLVFTASVLYHTLYWPALRDARSFVNTVTKENQS
jgi:hypothetical protein